MCFHKSEPNGLCLKNNIFPQTIPIVDTVCYTVDSKNGCTQKRSSRGHWCFDGC